MREHFREVQERAKGDREQLAGELLATQRRFHSSQIQMSEMQTQAGQMQRQLDHMMLHAEFIQAEATKQAEKMQEHAAHLDSSLMAARDRIEVLETSTTWRMTEPMRTAGHRAKVARARFRAGLSSVLRLPQLSALAWSILRVEGPAALAQRVRAKVVPEEPFKPAAPVHVRASRRRSSRWRSRPARRRARRSSFRSTASRC